MLRKSVETMAISEFKATCVVALERVRRTGTPVVVTRWGGPITEINPPRSGSACRGVVGFDERHRKHRR